MLRVCVLPALLCVVGATDNQSNATDSALAPGQSIHVVQYGSRKSDLVVHNYAGAGGAPLVLAMHGWGGSATGKGSLCNHAEINHWAKQYGFIGACPDGNGAGNKGWKSWNAKGCCGKAVAQDVDDVGFIREVVKYVKQRTAVTKVYAFGLSNGAMLSWRLRCEAADIFDGIAPVAGGFFGVVPPQTRSQQIPFFQFAKSVTVPDGWHTTKDDCSNPDFPQSVSNTSVNTSVDTTMHNVNASNLTVAKKKSCWHAHSFPCPLSSSPPPLLYVHGMEDTEEPYAIDVALWESYAKTALGCQGAVVEKKVGKATCGEMQGCRVGRTAFCSVRGLGHNVPSEKKHGFDAVQAAWQYWNGEFF